MFLDPIQRARAEKPLWITFAQETRAGESKITGMESRDLLDYMTVARASILLKRSFTS